MGQNTITLTITMPKVPRKDWEISTLHALAEELSHTSYLKTLFTAEFLDWAETQIRNDSSLDVCSAWGRMTEYQQEIRRLGDEIGEHMAKENDLVDLIGEQALDIKDLKAKLYDLMVASENAS